MEQKTNNSGQQAAPEQGTQEQKKAPSAWLQNVMNTVTGIANELDKEQNPRRAIITIVADEDNAAVITAGGSIPLALAVKEVLTGAPFAKHIANACRLMAAEAADKGDGTIVIHVKPEPDGGGKDQEAKSDED